MNEWFIGLFVNADTGLVPERINVYEQSSQMTDLMMYRCKSNWKYPDKQSDTNSEKGPGAFALNMHFWKAYILLTNI